MGFQGLVIYLTPRGTICIGCPCEDSLSLRYLSADVLSVQLLSQLCPIHLREPVNPASSSLQRRSLRSTTQGDKVCSLSHTATAQLGNLPGSACSHSGKSSMESETWVSSFYASLLQAVENQSIFVLSGLVLIE